MVSCTRGVRASVAASGTAMRRSSWCQSAWRLLKAFVLLQSPVAPSTPLQRTSMGLFMAGVMVTVPRWGSSFTPTSLSLDDTRTTLEWPCEAVYTPTSLSPNDSQTTLEWPCEAVCPLRVVDSRVMARAACRDDCSAHGDRHRSRRQSEMLTARSYRSKQPDNTAAAWRRGHTIACARQGEVALVLNTTSHCCTYAISDMNHAMVAEIMTMATIVLAPPCPRLRRVSRSTSTKTGYACYLPKSFISPLSCHAQTVLMMQVLHSRALREISHCRPLCRKRVHNQSHTLCGFAFCVGSF
mmetsp:Transcript_18079/g.54509  ORF Transcript_18079/g.54509 Transcript_18079/m.54509 type:complete len:297 (-) Transcript_18079:384-1274(-)